MKLDCCHDSGELLNEFNVNMVSDSQELIGKFNDKIQNCSRQYKNILYFNHIISTDFQLN